MSRRSSNFAWQDGTQFAQPPNLYAAAGRALLLLASALLIAIPFTQSLWTWDRFLHGGHDFETNMLLILASLCLVLVLIRRRNRGLELLFTSLACLGVPQWRPPIVRLARNSRFHGEPIIGPAAVANSLPLRI